MSLLLSSPSLFACLLLQSHSILFNYCKYFHFYITSSLLSFLLQFRKHPSMFARVHKLKVRRRTLDAALLKLTLTRRVHVSERGTLCRRPFPLSPPARLSRDYHRHRVLVGQRDGGRGLLLLRPTRLPGWAAFHGRPTKTRPRQPMGEGRREMRRLAVQERARGELALSLCPLSALSLSKVR